MQKESMQIKCCLANCLGLNRYEVKIYNSQNCLLYKGRTDKLGVFNFHLSEPGIYKIIVKPVKFGFFPYQICKNYYFNGTNKIIPFTFFTAIPPSYRTITIELTDKNYPNLPIKKGEIKIWTI